jgi:hypothetical protein
MVVAAIFFPAVALGRGQDINWDQLNYHFSASQALLSGDWWWNIAPSQMQTWFNPLGYLPSYWLAQHVGSRTFTVILALVHALNAPLVYLISREVHGADDPWQKSSAALATLIGMTAATVWGEIGTTFFDIVASLFVLAALLLLVRAGDRMNLSVVCAGLLIGAAVGLKLVIAVYAIAVALAWTLTQRWPRGLGTVALLGAGMFVGFLATAGWWMVALWQNYGNPFFPYFNSVFRSAWLAGVPPWIASGTGADTNFVPTSALKAAAFPLKWALGKSYVSSEATFRDPRVLTAGLLLAAAAIAVWRRSRKSRPLTIDRLWVERFVLSFWIISLVIWIWVFAIQRYLVTVEALGGIVMLIALRHSIRGSRQQSGCMAVLALALLIVTRPPDFGHLPFHNRMILDAELRTLYRPGALYVMLGGDPMGYVIPALPDDVRFVRIDGNMPLDPRLGFGKHVATIIAAQRGPLMTLAVGAIDAADRAGLARFGLRAGKRCRTAAGLGQHLVSCEIAPSTREVVAHPASAK